MAENKENKEKKQKTTRTWSTTKVLDCAAYFAIIFIAIALIFRLIFKEHTPNVAESFRAIGECLAYIICIMLGFYWTMRKKGSGWNKHNMWWLICWIIATVIIVVIYICNVAI